MRSGIRGDYGLPFWAGRYIRTAAPEACAPNPRGDACLPLRRCDRCAQSGLSVSGGTATIVRRVSSSGDGDAKERRGDATIRIS